jgi:hypothetical protein
MKKPTKKTAAKTVVDIKTMASRSPDWKRAARSLKAKPGDERRAALARLGVTEEQVAQTAEITSFFKLPDGGIQQCIAAMRLQRGDEVLTRFLLKYDTLSMHDRRHLPIEAICIAAQVDPVHLLGSTTVALERVNVSVVKLLTVANHVKIVQARLKYGLLPGGDKDRTAIDTAVGFLPSPRGPVFVGKAIFGSGQNAMNQQRLNGGDDEEDEVPMVAAKDVDLDRLFPAPRIMQEKLVAIRNRLPDPSKKPN